MISEIISYLSSTQVLLVALFVLIVLYLREGKSSRQLPPGPTGLPFVGYLPFLSGVLHEKLLELKGKYGPVYSLQLGSRYTVVLADFQSMKNAFSKDAFIGRPPTESLGISRETLESGAFTHLPWKKQRRFAMHLLHDLGFGRPRITQLIAEEIQELLEKFEETKGEPFSPRELFIPSTSNNISSLVFGKRRKFDDPKRILLDDILRKKAKTTRAVPWLWFFPDLEPIFHHLNAWKQQEFFETIAKLKDYIREEIMAHKETLDPNDIRDFIDGYLVEIEKNKHDPETTFKVPILEDTVQGFFSAGSATIRVTLEWILLAVVTYPDVQRKVQAEIDAVFGAESFPSWSEHQRMPYTEAVIMEILRWKAALPINFPRYTIADTELNGYFIPKGTTVIPLAWAVLHDPDLWGKDVHSFKPERFLSEDGKEIRKPEYYIPFSIGKRACTGEAFAMTELFMYITAILQKFNLKLPEGQKADLEGDLGLGFEVKPFELCAMRRT